MVAEIPFSSVNVTVKFHRHPSVPQLVQGTGSGIDATILAGPVGVRIGIGAGEGVCVELGDGLGVGVLAGV